MLSYLNYIEPEKFILINSRKGKKYILIKEIIFIKGSNKNSFVYTDDNSCIESSHLLKYFEINLPYLKFFRCHKSFIINLEYLEFFSYKSIYLKGNYIIKLSRNRRQEFLDTYKKYLQSTI